MKTYILPAIRLLLVLTVVTGVAYPLAMTLFASALFNQQASGSVIIQNGSAVGSALIGQSFSSPVYFHSRPSAIGYNPLPSSGSNFGPTSKALQDSTAVYRTRFRTENNLAGTDAVPKDMLSMSGSGLDPHISPEAALMQIDRIARARGFSAQQQAELVALVHHYSEGPEFGFLGEPRVNVLRLNLALDALAPAQNR
jgi:potassium-transporting ATPase KdpC subunit